MPLLAEIEALAVSARVSLAAVAPVEGAHDAAAFPDLTPREREILAHIVAGRTYAEIARKLVVSEKTVSVHVSNTLRKTGTANRVELAQLGSAPHQPGTKPSLVVILRRVRRSDRRRCHKISESRLSAARRKAARVVSAGSG